MKPQQKPPTGMIAHLSDLEDVEEVQHIGRLLMNLGTSSNEITPPELAWIGKHVYDLGKRLSDTFYAIQEAQEAKGAKS